MEPSTGWCYLFVHHEKMDTFVERIERKGKFETFVHRTAKSIRTRSGVRTTEVPTVSGLVFVRGRHDRISRFLNEEFSQLHLVNDCSTKRVAVIPDDVMRPFMRIATVEPTRVRVLLNPIECYANGRQRVRVTSGLLEGMEGYVVRIDRDRRLVCAIGNMTIAISGAHQEALEEAEETA